MTEPFVVGGTEWCSLPSLGIPHIEARVDSGAKTSALHAINIERIDRDGEHWVSFEVHPLKKDRRTLVRCEAPVVDRRSIRSTNGLAEKRFVVRTVLGLGDQSWEIELSLTDRDAMGHRMLLGREAMIGRVLVDPGASQCLGKVTEAQLRDAYDPTRTHAEGGLHIAILASSPDLYSNQRLVEAGRERGHRVTLLGLKDCFLKLDADSPQVHTRGNESLIDIDAVIPRIRPSMTFFGCALTRHFEALGKFSLNSSTSVRQSRDKLYALQLLLKRGLDIPTTGFAHSPVDSDELIDMVGGPPLIVKLLEGTQGRGVVLAETRKSAESTISAFKSLNANLLVQEYVKEANGKGLRCIVVDRKVTASILRESEEGDFRSNARHGGSAKTVRVTSEEKSIALRAAKALGLHVAGVDIIRSNRGPLLLDVDPMPGLESIEGLTNKDVAGAMIAAVERRVGWARPLSNAKT